MYIISALLVVILILLYRIYKKNSELFNLLEKESKYNDVHDPYSEHHVAKDWLRLINKRLFDSQYNIQNIDYALNNENPAGPNSAGARHLKNLIKLYAEYLENDEQLSKDEAEARSAFEFENFNHDELIDTINGKSARAYLKGAYTKGENIEKTFFETGLLEKDCLECTKDLIPHDVLEPIWELFNVQKLREKTERTLELVGLETSYEDYVKNRAIVLRMLDLGIIEKVTSEHSDSSWLSRPLFKFKKKDIEEIRSIIYEGKASHGDSHFKGRLEDGDLKGLFRRKFL